MRIINRIICLISVVMLLSVSFPAYCGPVYKLSGETFPYASFRDVPGVTEDEIKAIEAFQRQGISFVYGMTPNTETFYAEDNNIKGFAALFCTWLTEFFGIPFKPAIYEWEDLIAGHETGEVDFSGELTPTDERRKTYFMTDAIIARPIKYIRIEGSPPLSEIAAARPLRLGFLEGSTTYDYVVSSNALDKFEAFFVGDSGAVYSSLKSGETDAFIEEGVMEAAFDIYGDVTTVDFLPLIFSPISMATQNPALDPVISIVQKALQNTDGQHLAWLYNQGHREYQKNKMFLRLTEEEKAYIQMNPVVPFAAEIDNYPICF